MKITCYYINQTRWTPYAAEEHSTKIRKFLGWFTAEDEMCLCVGNFKAHDDLAVQVHQLNDKPTPIAHVLEKKVLYKPDVAGDILGSDIETEHHISGWRSVGFGITTPVEYREMIAEALGLPDEALF